MSETEATEPEPEGLVHGWRTRFHNWAVGVTSRQKIALFYLPVFLVGFILMFPPTFEAWINRVEPMILWIPWSIFSTHALLVFVGIWMLVLQRVDNAQAIERGEL